MQTLRLTLKPEGVSRVHDALICLAKFSESVSVEARGDRLLLTALNSSKSAHACFCLDGTVFFDEYHYYPSQSIGKESGNDVETRFTCQVYNKALLSVFKSRLPDIREPETALEKCEVEIQNQPDKTECRLVVKMICRHGVIKTYRLTYESVEVMNALFNKDATKSKWTISATVLRSFIEYFGATTEQLDIYSENGRATFTSYTDKVINGKEILKQPLETSIAIDTLDFEAFAVEEMVHVGISVKDFKAIVIHAESLKTSITAFYSYPNRPMRIAYEEQGMICEFTLMTIGDYRGSSVTPTPVIARRPYTPRTDQATSARSTSRNTTFTEIEKRSPQETSTYDSHKEKNNVMPPPMQPASRSFTRENPSQRPLRPSPPPSKPSIDPESLFLSAEQEEDRRWGDRSVEEEEDEDTLGWDLNAENGTIPTTFNRTNRTKETLSTLEPHPALQDHGYRPVAPTQRISEVESLFGE